jgi:hypothetical protein
MKAYKVRLDNIKNILTNKDQDAVVLALFRAGFSPRLTDENEIEFVVFEDDVTEIKK